MAHTYERFAGELSVDAASLASGGAPTPGRDGIALVDATWDDLEDGGEPREETKSAAAAGNDGGEDGGSAELALRPGSSLMLHRPVTANLAPVLEEGEEDDGDEHDDGAELPGQPSG